MSESFLRALQSDLGGRYRLRDEVARGGMAMVYRADDQAAGGEVAVKVLRPEIASAVGSERFLREIRILALLPHPSIVPLLDSGEAGGSLYLVTSFIPSASLQRRLERGEPLPLKEVVGTARDIAAALDAVLAQSLAGEVRPPEYGAPGDHPAAERVIHSALASDAGRRRGRPRNW